MRNGTFKPTLWLLLTLVGCGTPSASDEPSAWNLDSPADSCPEGATRIDTGLPDLDVFKQPICLVNHAAEDVKIQWANQKILRPECSTDIFADMRDYGLYGRVGFITDKRITSENNVCTNDFMQGCENYNIYLRVAGVSEVWHRFEVRRPDENCNYGHKIYAGSYYWYWRINIGKYLAIARFQTNNDHDGEGSRYHHIKIFNQACTPMPDAEIEEVVEEFSKVDIIFVSISSGKTFDYQHSKAERFVNETDNISFYTPIIGGCVSTSGFTWDSED